MQKLKSAQVCVSPTSLRLEGDKDVTQTKRHLSKTQLATSVGFLKFFICLGLTYAITFLHD